MGDPISKDDHIVRYVGYQSLLPCGEVDGSAFHDADNSPSVNWLECFEGTKLEQLDEVRRVIHMKRLGTKAIFAEMVVSTVLEATKKLAPDLSIVSDPSAPTEQFPHCDPSHAEIRGLPECSEDIDAVYDKLVECIVDRHPARKQQPKT